MLCVPCLPITPPALSFFPVLLLWPMRHHPRKQHFVWHQFETSTAEHLCLCSSTEDKAQLCCRDLTSECLPTALPAKTSVLNVFLITSKTGRGGELCCSSLTSFGAGSSLQIHRPCQILSVYLKTFITYCHLPPQTRASFSSFPPCAPSASLILHSLLFLISWPSLGCRISWNRTNNKFFLFFGHVSHGILVPWPGIEPAPPALESLNQTKS